MGLRTKKELLEQLMGPDVTTLGRRIRINTNMILYLVNYNDGNNFVQKRIPWFILK